MIQEKVSSDLESHLRKVAREVSSRKPLSPASVYRLQINPKFNFKQAEAIVPYLKSLGIKAVYLSPFFEASPGSMHGYDVTNPNCINSELGAPEDYDSFVSKLKEAGLSQVLDVVPNHMGILGNKNMFWQDVLENGPSSIYAKFFDIDWEPQKKELKDKVLIPILGDHIGRVIERKEIQLHFSKGEFTIHYWSHVLPVAPRTYTFILEYGIESLKARLASEPKVLEELLSTVTAFRNLPSRTETNEELIYERNREKEIAKSRLQDLYASSEEIRGFIHSCVERFNGVEGDPSSFDLLDELLTAQAYRMAYWRVAAEEINYRRFFDINELAAICIENDEVFEVYHQLLYRMIELGYVSGLRIDHPDGLYNPPEYFRKLQKRYIIQEVLKELEVQNISNVDNVRAITSRLHHILDEEEFRNAKPLLIVAEKILERKETLPDGWNLHGTVGYDFLNALNGLFIYRESEPEFSRFYEQFVDGPVDFEELTYRKKKFIALVHMASEMNHLALLFDRISEKNRRYRDFTVNNIAVAIREVIACFPVYRTYITPTTKEVSERDSQYIHIAIEKAKSKTPALSHALYDFLRDILLLRLTGELSEDEQNEYKNFILRFQQLTGPVMAKGLEDTAFYIYNRFISLNEVGGSPLHFGVSTQNFHKQNLTNAKLWNHSFLASSTHDTKRNEDVRMRLNVLSEIPEPWQAYVVRWLAANEKHKVQIGNDVFPDRNTEYFLYQTLVGVWPTHEMDNEEYTEFVERIWTSVQKSIREAKSFTNWVNPNEAYEQAVHQFILKVLARTEDNYFLKYFLPFQRRISKIGAFNSLSATLLKMGSPGIVDVYQGNEMLHFALVDPDNRRPVDYETRQKVLNEMEKAASEETLFEDYLQNLLTHAGDGRLKFFVTWRALAYRAQFPDLFLSGDYVSLQTIGSKRNNVVAFMRRKKNHWVLVAAARFFHDLFLGLRDESYEENIQLAARDAHWGDTKIVMPKDFSGAEQLKSLLTSQVVPLQKNGSDVLLDMSQLLSSIGVAMCEWTFPEA